ncbi:conserved hypothetical protein [Rhodopseudomonas palustris HaA2]|uniref:Lipoprotein n=1 Tax=Rhodopseudomonas palustris (strain HaA2) TaxID=316058 RepID=Q2IX72_RHOP2|nr:hypothetical protein [Rhodopseudomonas palustris]ABD07188.1 conserved hypothetical protein [Rhodopseudomonas palustris HaA2]
MQHKLPYRPVLLTLVLATPLLAGCAGGSDLLSRDADWFARPGRVFIKNISIETPPLTPDKAVTAEDLISADGMCPGMAQPGAADANANAQGGDPAASTMARGGTVALGHTECDVARGAGAPDGVNLSTNERGQRVALLTYSRGPRAGIYTFTAGRLTSIERAPEPAPQPRAAKKRSRS